MKHKLKVTLIIIGMFLITQFIGLYVVNHYSDVKVVDGEQANVTSPDLPYGMEPPEPREQVDYNQILISIAIAFVIAISLFFLFTHFKARVILKIWFFVVVVLALGIFFNSVLGGLKYSAWIALGIGLILGFFKIFKRDILVHNVTEFMVYPGIAAVFVPILNVKSVIILLILISVYDMWAVWKSKVMQKMAKFQMDEMKVFGGFFLPYLSKSQKKKLKRLRKQEKKSKSKKSGKKKQHSIKAKVAVLGGGDIVFPIIASGVMYVTLGLIPAILTIVGAALGLSYLLFFAKKKQFYPAMPFITTGILLAIALSYAFL